MTEINVAIGVCLFVTGTLSTIALLLKGKLDLETFIIFLLIGMWAGLGRFV